MRDADHIIVLTEDIEVEQGTRVALVARGGNYAGLYHIEFQGNSPPSA